MIVVKIKEDWLVGLDCLKYLKREWNRKEGRGNKDFKKGGKLGQGVSALKRRGLEPPYELCGTLRLECQNVKLMNTDMSGS